jgi:hypothetical protein
MSVGIHYGYSADAVKASHNLDSYNDIVKTAVAPKIASSGVMTSSANQSKGSKMFSFKNGFCTKNHTSDGVPCGAA